MHNVLAVHIIANNSDKLVKVLHINATPCNILRIGAKLGADDIHE